MNHDHRDFWDRAITDLLDQREFVLVRCHERHGYKPVVAANVKLVNIFSIQDDKEITLGIVTNVGTYTGLDKIEIQPELKTIRATCIADDGKKILVAMTVPGKFTESDEIRKWSLYARSGY